MKVDLGYFIVCLMKGQSMGGTKVEQESCWKIMKIIEIDLSVNGPTNAQFRFFLMI